MKLQVALESDGRDTWPTVEAYDGKLDEVPLNVARASLAMLCLWHDEGWNDEVLRTMKGVKLWHEKGAISNPHSEVWIEFGDTGSRAAGPHFGAAIAEIRRMHYS